MLARLFWGLGLACRVTAKDIIAFESIKKLQFFLIKTLKY